MSKDKLRRQVAFEAARLLCACDETKLYRAKMKAARRVYRGEAIQPGDLPSRGEIREQVLALARADRRQIGREGLGRLPAACVKGTVPFSLTRKLGQSPGSSAGEANPTVDRFHAYQMLLLPLEQVQEDLGQCPEGDVLYHSLQVFELARNELPCDEEFLLAALLHDVGKAIDPRDHVAAGLEALAGLITPRTAWLVEHHVDGLALAAGTLGVRSRRRLQASADFHELVLLARCDREGHSWGVPAPRLDEALDYLRQLAAMCGE
jgi:hypothetical protein